MIDQALYILNVTWPAIGLLVFVVVWTWLLTKDDRKPQRHLPPAE